MALRRILSRIRTTAGGTVTGDAGDARPRAGGVPEGFPRRVTSRAAGVGGTPRHPPCTARCTALWAGAGAAGRCHCPRCTP